MLVWQDDLRNIEANREVPAAAPALRRSAKVDIFGQVVSQQADDVVCMNCHRLINASRRAPLPLCPAVLPATGACMPA